MSLATGRRHTMVVVGLETLATALDALTLEALVQVGVELVLEVGSLKNKCVIIVNIPS